jgi:hypothetical protein
MRFCIRWLLVFGTTLLPFPQLLPFVAAQNTRTNISATPVSNLRLLTRKSGYIFDGTVLSVERIAATSPDSAAAVQITFRIEQAIRGVRNGEVLSLREWAGLWSSGDRYRVGERLLLFLYSPSKLGLTSPVGGALGRFAVDSGGNVILDDARLKPFVPAQALSNQTLPVQSAPGRILSDQTSLDPRSTRSRQRRMNSRAFALTIQHAAAE